MIAVVDIDGVLADATHRQHLVERRPRDWDGFFALVGADTVITRGRDLAAQLAAEHDVVLLSGRPERTRPDTEQWLARHGIAFSRLVLRPDTDHRPAAVFKAGAIAAVGDPEQIVTVIDDDEGVVAALRTRGYRAIHFA